MAVKERRKKKNALSLINIFSTRFSYITQYRWRTEKKEKKEEEKLWNNHGKGKKQIKGER